MGRTTGRPEYRFRLASLIRTGIDRLIPEELIKGDADSCRQARMIVASLLTMTSIGSVYVLVYFRIGAYAPGSIAGAAVLATLVVWWTLHRTRSCTLAGNLAITDLFIALTTTAMTMGGPASPTALWYSGMPILATSLAGRRSGRVWLALTLLAVAFLAVTESLGARFLDVLTVGQHRWLAMLALMGIVLVIQVLTELFEAFKNQMLREIRRSETRFRCAAEMSSDLIYEWDVGTHELQWFGDVDAALGYRDGEFAHTLAAWFDRLHPADQQRIGSHAQRYANATTPIREEYQIRYQDGSWRYRIDRAAPILDSKGRAVRWIGTCTDITARRQAEEELRRANLRLKEQTALANAMADQATAANRSKSEFLANMHHEIRTPMTAIRGFAEILRDETLCCPACPESSVCSTRRQNREYIGTICRNTEYLLSLINDILDLSRIEAGGLAVERIVCCPSSVVAEAESLMRVRAEAKGLDFTIKYESRVPESILSDPTRLRQIVINLLSNAVKFTETGSIRLLIRHVAGQCPTMEFDVCDTGVGMRPEEVARVFQPFTQADTSTTRRFGGSGLGLTISKRLAQLLGGDVAIVHTDPGVGARFRLTVAAPAPDNARMIDDQRCVVGALPAVSTSAGVPDAKLEGRILLAEDGPDNQRLISFLLKKVGAEVTIVENGTSAVDAALSAQGIENPFDVILMGMQMPVMDGYEATRILRARRYAGFIIALTAHAMASDRQKCLDAGCDDFISKPINRCALVEMLLRHTRQAAVGQAGSSG
jgi:PAS domain S-box-containing protein